MEAVPLLGTTSLGVPYVRKVLVTFLILTASWATAQHAATKPQPKVCSAEPGYRALDFWVGDWNIYEDGKPAGRQRVAQRLDDCTVIAEWLGPGWRQRYRLLCV